MKKVKKNTSEKDLQRLSIELTVPEEYTLEYTGRLV